MAIAPMSPSIPRKSDRTKPPANGNCSGGTSGGTSGGSGSGSGSGSGGAGQDYTNRFNETSAQDMYSCLRNTVGLSHNQAIGALANINRESAFNSAAVGDNGNSFGLFQFNRPAGRADPFLNAVPDWQTNPCGQATYMFTKDSAGKAYAARDFSSPLDAANYFTNNVEIPQDRAAYTAPGGYNSQIVDDLTTSIPNTDGSIIA